MEKAKIFMNGKSQAVRLPKKYRFDCDEVLVQEHPAGILLIDPDKRWELLAKFLAQNPIDETFNIPNDGLIEDKRDEIL